MDTDPLNASPHSLAEPTPLARAGGIPAQPADGRDPMESPFRIEVLDPERLPYLVVTHRKYFAEGFFARLGAGFLTAYSRAYITSPHARAYVAYVNDQPVGFLAGITDPHLHSRHVLRVHGHRLLMRGVLRLITHPGLALHFLRTRLVRYCRKAIAGRSSRRPPGPLGLPAVLSHVAVAEPARSLGIGAALISHFAKDSAEAGCARITLVTPVGIGGAASYYERRGWIHRGQTRTPDGRLLATYDWPLNGAGTQDR